mmetsp:Transcript_90031/g.155981  ORF Transcript_90031/g.155981 Transcript_90031/m.155981 type:complete len:548 (-) Transcript_90031:73-1716(-)
MAWLKDRITENYAALWQALIRPGRNEYDLRDLGYRRMEIDNGIIFPCEEERSSASRGDKPQFVREDFQIQNDRGMRLECSHYKPVDQQRPPCVIYLHGNCSSRVEALYFLGYLLPKGLSVVSFDCSGSGMSEGDYISLGYHEERDLACVISHLRSKRKVGPIGLWGHSMGAVTVALRAAQDPHLAACVMDSAFSNLWLLCEERVHNDRVRVPVFLLKLAMQVVSHEVRRRAGFEISSHVPVREVPFALAPALFAVATDDEMIPYHHTVDLYKAWGSADKKLVEFPAGGHAVLRRRPEFFEQVASFLQEKLRQTKDFDVNANLRSACFFSPGDGMDAEDVHKARASPTVASTDHRAPDWLAPISPDLLAELKELRVDVESSVDAASNYHTAEAEAPLDVEGLEDILQRSAKDLRQLQSSLRDMAPLPPRQSTWHSGIFAPHEAPSTDGREAAQMLQRESNCGGGEVGEPQHQEFNPFGSPPPTALPDELAKPPRPQIRREAASLSSASSGLKEQLLSMGISARAADEAARRCSSAEGAMEWLEATNSF